MRITRKGTEKVFNCDSTISYQNSVDINRIKENTFKFYFELNDPEIFVEFITNNSTVSLIFIIYRYSDNYESDFANYDIFEHKLMKFLFLICLSLSSLNLCNNNILKVVLVRPMDFYCSLLTSFNLSNLNTLQIIKIQRVFYYCHKIKNKKCDDVEYKNNWKSRQDKLFSRTYIYYCHNRLQYKYQHNGKKITNNQESDGFTSEVRNINNIGITFYFDYYKGTNEAKDTKKLNINFELCYFRNSRCKNLNITLNHLSLFNSNQYKIYFLYNNCFFQETFQIKNICYLLTYIEYIFHFKDSSQIKYNYIMLDKLSNINKNKDDNNLKIHKKTKFISSFITLFIEIELDKYNLYLLFIINIILMILKVIYNHDRREEKRREEKRREEKRREERKL